MPGTSDHVFISFSQHDFAIAEKLVCALKSADLPVWIASENLIPGTQDWELAIRDAIDHSFSVVFLASPDSRISQYARGELTLSKSKGKIIIPVWISGLVWSDCVPLESVFTQFIDLRENAPSEEFDKLVERLKDLHAQQWFERAIATKDVYEKVSFFTKVIRIRPNDPVAYYNRGLALDRTGDLQAMLEDFTAAIRLQPNYADAFDQRGNVYADLYWIFRREADLERAFEDYTAAIDLDPSHAKAFHNRAVVREILNDLEGALKDYGAAIRIDPCFGSAFYNRS
ncbi:MAG TPA: TIR domain-containing protein, partial [Bryobacteraceae bacterium]|nr:TIR domain-containing protein [Bryobacteraceae bacterium]